jgi:hypothetical protein
MKFKINIRKKHVFLLIGIFVLFSYGVVFAQPPFLHSADEISGACRTDGVGCPSCLGTSDVIYKVSASTQCANPILCYQTTATSTPAFLNPNGFTYNAAQGSYGFMESGTWHPCAFVFCRG